MNRSDIVEITQKRGGGSNLHRKTVREALDFVLEEILETLKAGESVKLTGFGTFQVRKRKDRIGRNPKTGEEMLIKSHNAVVFRPTKDFLEEK